jgi:catechol 2,3-dioxygenase-like lactoylglutathione lyase family enzyme
MKITEIAFVCYAVSGLKKARPFYEGVLGLKPTKEYVAPDGDMGMVEYDLGGSTIAIGCGAPMFKPGGNNVAVALEVEDFAAAVQRLKEHKVKFLLEPIENRPCHMALIEDLDGNPIMIHRRK